MDKFEGPFVIRRDEAAHTYVIPVDKEDRFKELMYGDPEDFDWAEDKHDVTSRFIDEFGHASRGLRNLEFYLKEE